MAQGGEAGAGRTSVVGQFRPDEVRHGVEAAVGLHNQMAVAAADWRKAPPDDHAAGQVGRDADGATPCRNWRLGSG